MLKKCVGLIVLLCVTVPEILVAETEFKPEVEKPIEQQWLEAHNSFRKSEGRTPLQWDTDLVKVAEKWLYNLKESCKLYNSKSGYGEALWGDISNPAILKTVEDWMAGYKSDRCSKNRTKGCVNAVQILWPSTSRVGCSEVNCVLKSRKNEIKSRTIMTIRGCIYDPPSLRRVK